MEPLYNLETHTWDKTCPCIRAEQRDPECPWHGREATRAAEQARYPHSTIMVNTAIEELRAIQYRINHMTDDDLARVQLATQVLADLAWEELRKR